MSTRLDIEGLVADTVCDYIKATLSAAIQATCPVVTFHDPMSIDDANRIIVMVPSGITPDYAPGNFSVSLEVGTKTQWSQMSMQTDWTNHMAAVSAVRNILWDDGLEAALDTQAADAIGFNRAMPDRRIATEVREQWYYTPTVVNLEVFTKTV